MQEFWKKVSNDPNYADMIDVVRNVYQENKGELNVIRYSERKAFYEKGSRVEGEKPYFKRRNYLSALAILALLEPEKGEYIEEIQDILWAICDEYCWAVPAHTSGELEDDMSFVDLFVCETGIALVEICNVLSERLDAKIKERVTYEVRRRVLEPFEKRSFWWETATTNWPAVCAGSIGMMMIRIAPEMLERQLPRILKILQSFISGYLEDGTCTEGVTYWGYGFAHFVWFSDMLFEFTQGSYDLFANQKIENIAAYFQKNCLKGGATVSYADCSSTSVQGNIGIQYYLHKRYPNTVTLLQKEYLSARASCNTYFLPFYKSFIHYDPTLLVQDGENETIYRFPSGQQIVVNRKKYSLAAKGGHNDEHHNHNDVGNVILATGEGQVICDLGAGPYSEATFNPKTRYDIFQNSSMSHNVPIIDGELQKTGICYQGTLSYEKNNVCIEMAEAYHLNTLRGLTRKIELLEKSIHLIDVYDGDCKEMKERFVTVHCPQIEQGRIRVADTTWYIDAESAEICVNKKRVLNHVRTEMDVYCIDFCLKPEQKMFELTIEID